MFSFFNRKPRKAEADSDLVKKLNSRAAKIRQSGVNDAFTPSRPIDHEELLAGRDEELMRCSDFLMSRGLHVLLYGDRGVGKSSIGYVLSSTVGVSEAWADYECIIHRCDERDTLRTIFAEPLRSAGQDVDVIGVTDGQSASTDRGASVGVGVSGIGVRLGAGSEQSEGTMTRRRGAHHHSEQPSWIARQLAAKKIFFFIDELDKVRDRGVLEDLANTIKHVSDAPGTMFKFLLAGIAQNGADLTVGHASVQRCLKEMKVDRLRDDALRSILAAGEKMVSVKERGKWRSLRFTDQIKDEIGKKSFGYPYFTHLIGHAAALKAIDREDHFVDEEFELNQAVDEAVKNAEGILSASIEHVTKNDPDGVYRRLLIVASETTSDFITAGDWSREYEKRWGESVEIANRVKRMVADKANVAEWREERGVDPIFVREASGNYRFHDARMPSFIRLAMSGAANDLARTE